MIILDTNVVSEVLRPHPSTEVREWIFKYSAATLFTTTITQAEILYGVALMPEGKRRLVLQVAVDAMFGEDFIGRILPFKIVGLSFAIHGSISRAAQANTPIAKFPLARE